MSQTNTVSTAQEVLQSRHSVRNFKKNTPIADKDLNEILELATTAPSSWNLQHWRFLVIRKQENKDRLLSLAYNQQQVADASAVIIVLGDLEANLSAPAVYADAGTDVRDMMVNQINSAYTNNPAIARDEAIRNASFAAMQLMLAAKAKGFDSVPMGGYDAGAVIKDFKIPSRYVPVVMIPIGIAEIPARPTGRFPLEQQLIQESF